MYNFLISYQLFLFPIQTLFRSHYNQYKNLRPYFPKKNTTDILTKDSTNWIKQTQPVFKPKKFTSKIIIIEKFESRLNVQENRKTAYLIRDGDRYGFQQPELRPRNFPGGISAEERRKPRHVSKHERFHSPRRTFGENDAFR